jgi:xanthine dehydrogenase YagS FAD-binding subunit
MKNFAYINPKTIESIPAILQKTGDKGMIYAGGTDALARMKEGIHQPEQLINIKILKDLNYIRSSKDGLHIGATTPLVDLVENKVVQKNTGLFEAVKSIGTIQLRNMGTVGGNLCQRPRCWYYRSRHFDCLRKGGEICYAVSGENKYHAIIGGDPCFIVHPSDLAPMLAALKAKVVIQSVQGKRIENIGNFFVLPETDPYNETILKSDELLTEIQIPNNSVKSHYVKFRERKSIDFAIVSVAVAAQVSGKKLTDVRIALGGVAPVPWRARKSEKILEGKNIDDLLLEKAGKSEMQNADPLDQNAYKTILVKNLIKRAVNELIDS